MREITAERQVLTLEEYIDKYFPVVNVTTLSLDSEFLRHEPETKWQKMIKDLIVFAIISKVPDFRAQVMDPSLDENSEIYYKSGMPPATSLSASSWRIKAEMFIPERESRLGNMLERAAFLGLIIEHLINEENYHKELAWRAVCDNSKELANYLDSPNSEASLERTGSRKIGQWYDLGNTYKIVYSDMLGFFLCGGWSFTYGDKEPLAKLKSYDFPNAGYGNSTGWVVLPKV